MKSFLPRKLKTFLHIDMWNVCLITAVLINTTDQMHYIVPNNGTPCDPEVNFYTCLTLEEFAENIAVNKSQENVTLIIAPGKHCFTNSVKLFNKANILITGQSDGISKPEICCKQQFCFLLRNSTNIHIENLVFTKYFSEDSDGGAILVSDGKLVHIVQCSFVNNVLKNKGGTVRLQFTDRVYIVKSQFINNSVVCEQSEIINKIRLSPCIQKCDPIFNGAISSGLVSLLKITDSYFDSNTAPCYGGAIVSAYSNISLYNCKFTKCSTMVSADSTGGGALYITHSNFGAFDSTFDENHSGYHGGGIFSLKSTAAIQNCSFSFNSAWFSGGAVHFYDSKLSINHSYFISNSAYVGGAANVVPSMVDASISNSTFLSNTGESGVGALAITNISLSRIPKPGFAYACSKKLSPISGNPVVSVVDSTFRLNQGKYSAGAISAAGVVVIIRHCDFVKNIGSNSTGAAIFVALTTLYFQSNNFINNNGSLGGSVNVFNGILYSINNTHQNNSTLNGGALFVTCSTVVSQYDQYTANNANNGIGGAVYALLSNITITRCEYSSNSAYLGGGALFLNAGRYTSNKSIFFANNSSQNGSALSISSSLVRFDGDLFQNNIGEQRSLNSRTGFQDSTLQLIDAHGICSNLTFIENTGSLYLFYSTLNFTDLVIFKGNSGITGGAITLIQSTVFLEHSSWVTVAYNTASYGGGMFLSQSKLNVQTHHLLIDNNTAKRFGGGVYGYQSQLTIVGSQISDLTLFTRNFAPQGGALFAVASSLFIFHGSVVFLNNEALRGGAVALSESSKIYIQKTVRDIYNEFRVKLIFSNNSADYGGAIYVLDDSNTGVLCQQKAGSHLRPLSTKECFLQTLRLYFPLLRNFTEFNYVNTFFQFNEGNKAGNDIFGGLLDRCQINAFSEIYNLEFDNDLSGFDYLKTIVQFQIKFDYNQTIQPFNLQVMVSNITRDLVADAISSDPVQLCFCEDSIYNCSSQLPRIFTKRGETFSIKAVTVDQVENPVNEIVLARVISDGTRLKAGQARQVTADKCTELVYNVFSTEDEATFEVFPDGPCSYIGISSKKVQISFQPCICLSGLQPALLDNECRCECDSFASTFSSYCRSDGNNSITIVRRMSKYWIQYVNSNNALGFQFQNCPYDYCLSTPVNLTINLPLNVDKQCAFNRTGIMCGGCKEGLSLVFGSSRCVQCSNNPLALLIAFAAAGVALVTLILVLNLTVATGTTHGIILYANIVAANSPTFLPSTTPLQIFVSWLNLDFGIETCFYDGMDSYAKVLLQLVFPIYIILLSILIIIVSNYWGWFAGLIGRKNPVATLCTLFLLSYSKLLRTIIACLQFTHLTYPDGSRVIFWFYNPNILYFTPSRIPFFIIATITIALGTVYTALLFLGQWLRKISGRKLMRCFRSNKYNAFIDAYHASFVLKHRYWLGILLIVRIIHHILSALLEESTHMLVVSCLMCALLILKQLLNKVYKSRLIDLLESSFLVNLLLFATSTYYVSNTNSAQIGLANTSVSIAFITFMGIVVYHCHTHFLTSFSIYRTLLLAVKNCQQTCKQKVGIVNTNNSTTQRDTRYTRLQQRDHDLDIIAPITAKDYRPPTPVPSISKEVKPVTTTTVVVTK